MFLIAVNKVRPKKLKKTCKRYKWSYKLWRWTVFFNIGRIGWLTAACAYLMVVSITWSNRQQGYPICTIKILSILIQSWTYRVNFSNMQGGWGCVVVFSQQSVLLEAEWCIRPSHSLFINFCLVVWYASLSRTVALLWTSLSFHGTLRSWFRPTSHSFFLGRILGL